MTTERLSGLLSEQLFNYGVFEQVLAGLDPDHFDRCGYVGLPGLLTDLGLMSLRSEVERLMPVSSRKDFLMECMDGTPRHMSTLGGLTISKSAPGISKMYEDQKLLAALNGVVGRNLVVADDPVERHVLNMLHRSGDTHGYHVDDYPIALVVFIESPDCEDGCGRLEFCPVGASTEAAVMAHGPGDAYLLRADRFNHRVQPIHDGCLRTVLNFAYGVEGHQVAATPSASLLYD